MQTHDEDIYLDEDNFRQSLILYIKHLDGNGWNSESITNRINEMIKEEVKGLNNV